MNKLLPGLAISTLLLTGCATPTPESKPEYDEVELMVWQSCIDGFIDEPTGFYSTNEILMDRAIEACQKFTPKKQ